MITEHPLIQVHLTAPQQLLWIALAHHGDIILAANYLFCRCYSVLFVQHAHDNGSWTHSLKEILFDFGSWHTTRGNHLLNECLDTLRTSWTRRHAIVWCCHLTSWALVLDSFAKLPLNYSMHATKQISIVSHQSEQRLRQPEHKRAGLSSPGICYH